MKLSTNIAYKSVKHGLVYKDMVIHKLTIREEPLENEL